jgi:hypothetical protein
LLGSSPTAAYPTHSPAHVSYAAQTNSQYPTHIMKAQVRLAAPAERRGGFGTFGWTMWAAGMTRNLPSLGGQLDHNEPGLQLEESTSCFQCKKTDSEAAGHRKTTGSPNVLARRTRLRPRATDLSPRAGSRQPRLTVCSAAAAPPRAPRPGRLPAGPATGHPTARTPGSG